MSGTVLVFGTGEPELKTGRRPLESFQDARSKFYARKFSANLRFHVEPLPEPTVILLDELLRVLLPRVVEIRDHFWHEPTLAYLLFWCHNQGVPVITWTVDEGTWFPRQLETAALPEYKDWWFIRKPV